MNEHLSKPINVDKMIEVFEHFANEDYLLTQNEINGEYFIELLHKKFPDATIVLT